MIDLTIINKTIVDTYRKAQPVVWMDKPDRELDGVFDKEYWAAELEGDVDTATAITVLAVEDKGLDRPQVGERLIVENTIYRITDRRPDSEGWAVLLLELYDA